MYVLIVMTTTSSPTRHQLRSRDTKSRLCGAAIEALALHGLHQFSFVKVCEISGLSRGAIHHHYTAPADLLADVVVEIYQRLSSDIAKDLERTERGGVDLDVAIDVLWTHFRTEPFRVLLEIRAAAGSDAVLAAAISDPNDQISWAAVDAAASFLAGRIKTPLIRLIFAALIGMALQYFTMLACDGEQADDYATGFVALLKTSIDQLQTGAEHV